LVRLGDTATIHLDCNPIDAGAPCRCSASTAPLGSPSRSTSSAATASNIRIRPTEPGSETYPHRKPATERFGAVDTDAVTIKVVKDR